MYARTAAHFLTHPNTATVGKLRKEVMLMEDAAREARNKYKREWYAKNKDRQREYERRYWKRKADSDRKKTEETGKDVEQA